MRPHELIAEFEALTEAPDGVTRLRELVLELAVRGKLVGHDPADEPASVLLRRIAKERQQRGGRSSKGGPVCSEETPFDLPPSWAWVRFGDLFECRLGKMLDKAKNRGPRRPYLRNANVRWGAFDLGHLLEMRVEDDELAHVSACRDDLVICEGGEPGRAAVWQEEAPIVIQKALHRARPYLVHSRYYQLHLRIDCASGRIRDLVTGATIMHLTGQMLDRHLVTLPPLAEQRRIVARVDELMGILDRLEVARTTRDTTRIAVRDSALDVLREAESPDDVEAGWSRFAGRMDDLLCNSADIAALRQTILQLAVRGRLVRQDPAEEPASVLLRRIAGEKNRMVTAGEIPKPRPLPVLSESDARFSLPQTWAWCRLGMILRECRNGTSAAPNEDGVGFPILRISACTARQDAIVDLRDHKFVEVSEEMASPYFIQPGDLLACRYNGNLHYVGRVAMVPDAMTRPILYPDKLIRLVPIELSRAYVCLAINAEPSRAQIRSLAATTAGNIGINGKQLQSLVVPVPPLGEQFRIVARVDELMRLLDRFEARLTSARAAHTAFAAAAVHHLDA